MRQVFRTGNRSYTVQALCEKWGQDYHNFQRRGEDPVYKTFFTYLNYEVRLQPMINTTNWIERQQKDLRRVTRAMPQRRVGSAVGGQTVMNKKSYLRSISRSDLERELSIECEKEEKRK